MISSSRLDHSYKKTKYAKVKLCEHGRAKCTEPLPLHKGSIGIPCAILWRQSSPPEAMLLVENISIIWNLMKHTTLFSFRFHVNPTVKKKSVCFHMNSEAYGESQSLVSIIFYHSHVYKLLEVK